MPEPRRFNDDKRRSARYGSKLSRALAIPALLLLAASVWHIAPKGLASAWYFKANNALELWSEYPTLFSQHSWQQASQAIDQAIRLDPEHPHYLLTKAKMHEWGWYGGWLTSKELEQTEQYYLRAIKARPRWPNAYADYGYYLGVTQFRITEAFEQLQLAKHYGPFQPETLLRQLAVGLLRWDKLNPQQKTSTLNALKNAVLAGKLIYGQALLITRQAKQTQLACTYLTLSSKDFLLAMQQRIQKDFCTDKA